MTRITTKQAAVMLGVDPQGVRVFAKTGWLRGITNSGAMGQGKRLYFDRDEVEAFARGGAPAAKAYREGRETVAPKRGRKQKV